ncbi:TetR family transcriptional regulator [Chromohalobacter marismortui]|uniref:TetR family transcriptional regulator n=1 Tax=Chromohalobacter marismortui TaxID=42055 RepID=A0A4R7NMT9_9GAMM|nr:MULTISPECIES: TetR/AcrR family transcriptional regulator [Chromohalobacter]MCI0509976.1 TetR/AcrR family transcriptional regulator [Chromohalobacter sp.]MCI0593092.1 TetR/AcrR family transcriptional regulator [Chromohalobacter sp.]TDU22123.1 TetR family transcriptional regulator [Chromohalobacter marismortui]
MKWQQRKSLETQQKLLSAALACLERDGFHNFRLDRVASEANVSKGALTHHFSNKDDLLAHAIEKVLDEFVDALAHGVDEVHAGRLTLDGFLDLMWLHMSGQLYMVTLEIALKARHEPSFRTLLTPQVQSFHERIDAIWQQLFPHLSPARATHLMNLSMNLLRGMGTQSVFRKDAPYFNDLLNGWKAILRQQVAS